MLLVHAGNRVDLPGRETPRFPPSMVPLVRRRVAEVLEELRPSAVVSAAAAGADLIVLEEAARLGIPTHVALPLGVAHFRSKAVEDLGPDWEGRYDRILDHAAAHGTVHIEDRGDSDAWYMHGNETILDRAAELAGTEPVYALVIRPHGGGSDRSATDAFAESAAARGWPVVELAITPEVL